MGSRAHLSNVSPSNKTPAKSTQPSILKERIASKTEDRLSSTKTGASILQEMIEDGYEIDLHDDIFPPKKSSEENNRRKTDRPSVR